jgi:hypothetical protein
LGMTTPWELPICRMLTCTARIVITMLFRRHWRVKQAQYFPFMRPAAQKWADMKIRVSQNVLRKPQAIESVGTPPDTRRRTGRQSSKRVHDGEPSEIDVSILYFTGDPRLNARTCCKVGSSVKNAVLGSPSRPRGNSFCGIAQHYATQELSAGRESSHLLSMACEVVGPAPSNHPNSLS